MIAKKPDIPVMWALIFQKKVTPVIMTRQMEIVAKV